MSPSRYSVPGIFRCLLLRALFLFWISCILFPALNFPLVVCGGVDGIPRSPTPTPMEYAAIHSQAEHGNPEAQLYMGILHANGQIVQQDFVKAAEWYLIAAESNNATAQRNLGVLYDFGIGVEQDDAKAAMWYRKAAKNCDPAAYMGMARFAFTHSESAVRDTEGTYQDFRLIAFAVQKLRDEDGPAENAFWRQYTASMKYFQEDGELVAVVRQRAEQGDSGAQLRLAVCHLQGQGAAVSEDEFVKCIVRASEHSARALFVAAEFGFFQQKSDRYWWHESLKQGSRSERPVRSTDFRIKYIKITEAMQAACKTQEERYFCFAYHKMLESSNDPFHRDQIVAMALDGYLPASHHLLNDFNFDSIKGVSDEKLHMIVEKGVEQNDLRSMLMLVYLTAYGIGHPRDMDRAFSLMKTILDSTGISGAKRLRAMFENDNNTRLPRRLIPYLREKTSKGDHYAEVILNLWEEENFTAKLTPATIDFLDMRNNDPVPSCMGICSPDAIYIFYAQELMHHSLTNENRLKTHLNTHNGIPLGKIDYAVFGFSSYAPSRH